MNITLISSSPKKYGTTALLAQQFIDGASEKGHVINRFDCAFSRISPCSACEYCHKNDNNCVFNDAMNKLYPKLLESDCIVFVTPLYYFGMNGQMKTVIDRFYAINSLLKEKARKTILIASAGDDQDWVIQPLVDHYKTIIKYMQWEDVGILLAMDCATKSAILKTEYPEQAFKLGNSL